MHRRKTSERGILETQACARQERMEHASVLRRERLAYAQDTGTHEFPPVVSNSNGFALQGVFVIIWCICFLVASLTDSNCFNPPKLQLGETHSPKLTTNPIILGSDSSQIPATGETSTRNRHHLGIMIATGGFVVPVDAQRSS